MPKNNKVYEHDYEWSGQENESKGVNINEKNPWNKPEWGIKPAKQDTNSSSYANQPDRFGMDELQRRHQWEKPDWATMQKGGRVTSQQNNDNADIIKDPIPKPMLKKTAAGVASGIQGASSTTAGMNTKKSKSSEENEREIAEMEQRIEAVRRKKADLEKQKLEEAEEAARQKHTVEESNLERARRLAKEREEVRWRATLAERNLRDKEQRELARRLAASNNKSSSPASSDVVWEKTQQEQQVRYQERVQKEAAKRQKEEEMLIAQQQHYLDTETKMQRQEKRETNYSTNDQKAEKKVIATPCVVATCHVEHDDSEYEEIEEEIIEEYTEEYTDEYEDDVNLVGNGCNPVDEIQRQIDALRKQLEEA